MAVGSLLLADTPKLATDNDLCFGKDYNRGETVVFVCIYIENSYRLTYISAAFYSQKSTICGES